MLEWCVAFFVLGFLTDKVRIFPLVLGMILGILLNTLLENFSDYSINTCGSYLYDKYTGPTSS